ncbi:MAG: low-specificity L-threonine aldolase [Dehalococcoidia bacterium]|nr:low-specificity L-threonine aldolase [Dehalococcoidia bacterium]
MNVIDLRSDTVTLPTDEMRKAIATATLGDDVSGEDPTVNKLEQKAADLTGKEASLLVSSGTQGNLIAILANCQNGDEIIVGENAHIFWNESAGAAALGGVQTHLVRNQPQGALDPSEVSSAIRPKGNPHFPPTSLICLENTQNISNGGVLTVDDTKDIWDIANQNQIKVHLDGARIFNAAVYLETPVKELVKYTDTLTFCLSKGLSAPVGSLLCGDRDFITRARRWRKMLGGGMRQAGIIAAAGIVALDSMIERLRDDHTNALRFSDGLSTIPGIIHDPSTVQTNILFFDIDPMVGTMPEFVSELEKSGIRVHSIYGRIRLVTHRHITHKEVDIALQTIAKVLKSMGYN